MHSPVISVNNLVKEYDVYARPLDVAIEVLTRRLRHTKFTALNGISFEVPKGQVVGIIGTNGAGKSTLLKIITGVLDPTSGSVSIHGRVTAILELGLGFNLEYSGRENIYLSGLLYGMDREEVDRKIESIIDFSGLGDFIERPVKTYSSGMHARLAFSIATAVDPDILIIDEALAAGDSAFVQKCLKRIRELCSGGRTVLLVSHGTGLLAQLCDRVLWIENGSLKLDGSAIQVVQAYDLAAHEAADRAGWIETVDDDLSRTPTMDVAVSAAAGIPSNTDQGRTLSKQVYRRGPIFIDSVDLLNSDEQPTDRLLLLNPFKIRIHYHVEGDMPSETLGIALAINNKHDLGPIAQFMTQNIRPIETRETYDLANDRSSPHREGVIDLAFDYVPFRKGEYLLSIGLLPNVPACWQFYEYRHFYYTFTVDDAGMDIGAPIVLKASVKNSPKIVHASPMVNQTAEPESPGRTLRDEIREICFEKGGYPDAWPRHDECPACGQKFLKAAFSKYGIAHRQCSDCSFVCVDPFPPKAVLASLYDGEYYNNVREFFELPLLRSGSGTPFSAPLDTLVNVVETASRGLEEGSWLDVGGGLGAFAKLVQDMRPHWQVALNEMNKRSVALADELGVTTVETADPSSSSIRHEYYDVVSSVAVVEHIAHPLNFLEEYLDRVKPGGCLVTVIPQFSPLNAAVSRGSSANVVPPFHLSLFNESSFRQMLERLPGVARVEIEQSGPPAFDLIQHVDFGDHWDITIPTKSSPSPQSVQVLTYSDEEANALAVLAEANNKLGDFFGERDGRLMLVGYCWKA